MGVVEAGHREKAKAKRNSASVLPRGAHRKREEELVDARKHAAYSPKSNAEKRQLPSGRSPKQLRTSTTASGRDRDQAETNLRGVLPARTCFCPSSVRQEDYPGRLRTREVPSQVPDTSAHDEPILTTGSLGSGIKWRPRGSCTVSWEVPTLQCQNYPGLKRNLLVAIGNPALGEGTARCAGSGDVSKTESNSFPRVERPRHGTMDGQVDLLGVDGSRHSLCFSHLYSSPRRLALTGTFEMHGERTTICSDADFPVKSGDAHLYTHGKV